MATDRASRVSTDTESFARWASWIAALVGVWVLASPFLLSGTIGAGTPMWSAVVSGLAIVVLAGYGAYGIRTAVCAEELSPGEVSGWLAALAGVWIAVSPFVLGGPVGEGAVMWSSVVAGAIAVVLGAYAGYYAHDR